VMRRTPVKAEQLSEFETLCATEKVATQRALDKRRGLADRIKSELRKEKPEPFDHVVSLADFLASLERAASALEEKSRTLAKNDGMRRRRSSAHSKSPETTEVAGRLYSITRGSGPDQ
jgi:hypothetical protein